METSDQLLVPELAAPGEVGWAERRALFMQHGVHSQAFTGLQPGMEYFDVEGVGYLAHQAALGSRFVLGDPVCEPAAFPQLIDAFLARHPSSLFFQCSRRVIDHLHGAHGFYGTQIGSESKIPLADWSTSGSSKKTLRTAWNQAAAQGIEVREGGCDADAASSVSAKWLQTRSMEREVRFVIRPATGGFQEGVRRFYAWRDGEPLGFIFFDPIYSRGRVAGYIPNISRASAGFRQGLWYVMMLHAMQVFKAEGIGYVDLGITPLKLADEREPQESRPLRWALELFRDRGRRLYDFAGLQFAKDRFGGQVEKTYVGHRSALPVLAVPGLLRLCGAL
jgi:phosphatidylglycerol lysyltransferase